MSAKKCCCCGLLSCFPCFSAQPDSSEIAAPPLTVITNPSPAATLSFAPPSAVAPSQVNASTVMQNDSQTTAPSDAVPSSSRGIVTPSALIPTTSQTTASPPTQPPSFSTPSSSRLPKESDYAETIMEAVKELDKENVDGDFSDLISYISRLLDFIEAEMGLCQFDVINQIDMRLRKGQELKYPESPKGAVGIEAQLEEVNTRLDMESDKNVVAVIVHGPGGMGKTTLADAVFARLIGGMGKTTLASAAKIEGYKYSYVRLFDTIASVPDVVKLQRCILTDLMMGKESEIPEIRRYEEGQQVIEDMLEKEAAFIYIDNVLLPDKVEQGRDALDHLLPINMRKARKLRLLLTTREEDAVRITGVNPVFYCIQSLPENHTPSIARSDVPSSSIVLKEPDHTKQITGAVDAVDTRNVNADLNDLSNYISQYLAFIKGKGNKPSPVSATWPGSKCLFKLRDVLSDAAKISEALCPDAKTIAQRFLQGMGAVNMLTTGFLVVANIMERCEKIEDNKKECESLLEKMNTLIQFVKDLHKDPRLKEWMETHIEKAVKLIIEVTLACYTQTKQEKFIKFFSTTVNQEVLVNLKQKLTDLHEQIHLKMFVHLNNGIEKIHNSIEKIHNRKVSYPLYQERAYGIQNQVDNVIRLLECESDETGIAVILYGLGGMGKTTLADAVFATVRDKENMGSVKYSFVRLFVNIGSVPKIPKLQNCILRDLNMGEASAIPEIPSYKEGQNEIAGMLKETEAFIYIDGVLFPEKVEKGRDAFEELLPTNMRNAKKLRLLITARDKGAAGGVCKKLGLKTNFYPIETLPDNEATRLVNEKLNDELEIIDSRKIEQIVDICGGIPRLLIQVATFIRNLQDRQEAQTRYEMVISERENKWNGEIGKDIARYVFAYEYFDEILRDPFLDICSYFQGWQWGELSNIFEDFKLNSLENMALVTKDERSMTARVHKVILAIGLKRTEGERFKFTSGSEFQDFLNKTDEDLCGIKGIWSNDNIGPLDIPASKLDLMCGSLRVLALQNSTTVSGRCNRTFEELFFFSAQSDDPFDRSKVKKLRHSGYRPDNL